MLAFMSGHVGWANVQAINVKFSQDLTYQKSLKSVNFWLSYWKNKKGGVFLWTQCTTTDCSSRCIHVYSLSWDYEWFCGTFLTISLANNYSDATRLDLTNLRLIRNTVSFFRTHCSLHQRSRQRRTVVANFDSTIYGIVYWKYMGARRHWQGVNCPPGNVVKFYLCSKCCL